MQLAAPEAFDIGKETELTRKAYGMDEKVTEDFGRRCLLARRLCERGTRLCPGVVRSPGQQGKLGQPRQHSSGVAAHGQEHRQAYRCGYRGS